MARVISELGSEKNLKFIFRTLQNQTREIFRGDHNAQSASITTCLENLGQLILEDDDEYLDDLKSFIGNGVFQISGHYGSGTVTPTVLNFLMTAIRSYNHIIRGRKTQYQVALDTCQGLSDTGNAFLMQVLIPRIDAGALHVFPPDEPLVFDIRVKKAFIIRSPSPLHGRRPGSSPISFGQAFDIATRRQRRKARRAAAKPGEAAPNSNSSATGSSSDGDGAGSGGRRRKITKRLKNIPRRSIRRANK